ncbi:Kinesin light chain [Fusarium oxysporum f. sp. albedinis]|jgi:hypothetical protein|nr:Kinesin light chain [Fusarium oxysporum f. sp. albedinis]
MSTSVVELCRPRYGVLNSESRSNHHLRHRGLERHPYRFHRKATSLDGKVYSSVRGVVEKCCGKAVQMMVVARFGKRFVG